MWPKDGFYALDVFPVDLAKTRELIGSKDEGLFNAASRRARTSPWRNYKWFANGADPLLANLEHLVMGVAAPRGDDAKYGGHALRLLTSMHAKRLPVSAWTTVHKDGLPSVDKALRKLGVRLKLSNQMQAGAPVRLPAHPKAPPLGHVTPAAVASTATLLADAVAAARITSTSREQCDMRKPAGKRFHSWSATVVGTDVIQVYRSASGKEDRVVSGFRDPAMTRCNYEGYIADREAEGYEVVTRTKAAAGAKAKTNAVAIDGKVLARLEEASTWYAAAAKKRLGLMFFMY